MDPFWFDFDLLGDKAAFALSYENCSYGLKLKPEMKRSWHNVYAPRFELKETENGLRLFYVFTPPVEKVAG